MRNSPGSSFTPKRLPAGIFGSVRHKYASATNAATATHANVMRQPSARPMERPSGRPHTTATAEPVAMQLSASELRR